MADLRTKLQKFIENIEPTITIDPIEQKLNVALEKFELSGNTVRDIDEAHRLLARFVQMARNAGVGAPASAGAHDGINYSQAIHYLSKEYPVQTEYVVRDIMINGFEGGVYQILRVITRSMAEEIALNSIRLKSVKFWNSLTVEEKVKMPGIYIELYSHMLPEYVKGPGKYHLAAFWNVLEQHPGMVKRWKER